MLHALNYWAGGGFSTLTTGRVYVTASVTSNTFTWDAGFLSTWAAAAVADGNNPAETTRPATITVGSGFSAEAPWALTAAPDSPGPWGGALNPVRQQ